MARICTLNGALKRLVAACGKLGTGERCPLTADMIWQEDLVVFQERLTKLLEDLANSVQGGPAMVYEKFPYLFSPPTKAGSEEPKVPCPVCNGDGVQHIQTVRNRFEKDAGRVISTTDVRCVGCDGRKLVTENERKHLIRLQRA